MKKAKKIKGILWGASLIVVLAVMFWFLYVVSEYRQGQRESAMLVKVEKELAFRDSLVRRDSLIICYFQKRLAESRDKEEIRGAQLQLNFLIPWYKSQAAERDSLIARRQEIHKSSAYQYYLKIEKASQEKN